MAHYEARYQDAEAHYREAIEIAEAGGELPSLLMAYAWLAGDFAERRDFAYWTALAEGWLGAIEEDRSRLEGALQSLDALGPRLEADRLRRLL